MAFWDIFTKKQQTLLPSAFEQECLEKLNFLEKKLEEKAKEQDLFLKNLGKWQEGCFSSLENKLSQIKEELPDDKVMRNFRKQSLIFEESSQKMKAIHDEFYVQASQLLSHDPLIDMALSFASYIYKTHTASLFSSLQKRLESFPKDPSYLEIQKVSDEFKELSLAVERALKDIEPINKNLSFYQWTIEFNIGDSLRSDYFEPSYSLVFKEEIFLDDRLLDHGDVIYDLEPCVISFEGKCVRMGKVVIMVKK